jgi:hypothetical protein
LDTTTTITSFLSATPPSGCNIGSALITNPATEFNIETFFGGAGCSVSTVDVASSLFPRIIALGTYSVTINSQVFTLDIGKTATAVSEPSNIFLVGIGLLAIFIGRDSQAADGRIGSILGRLGIWGRRVPPPTRYQGTALCATLRPGAD